MSETAPGTPRQETDEGRRLVWWIVFGLVIAWSTFLFFFGPRTRTTDLGPPSLKKPLEPRRADYRWTLRTLDGQAVEFSRYRGQTVFLNLWATWCPPCVAELPSIDSLAANARLKGVAFVCVATNDSELAVRSFVKRQQMKVPVLVSVDPPPEPFLTEAIPATFVIGPDGRILSQEVGAAQWDLPEVVDFLESLVKSSGEEPRS